MASFWRVGIVTVSATLLFVATGGGGCAASPVDEDEGGDGGESATTVTVGAGGAGMGGAPEGGGDTGSCAMNCSAIDTPQCYVSVCNEGRHPGPVGECVVVPDDDGVACDDGQFCTVDDSCQTGVCTGGPQNDCGMAPTSCSEVVCDETAKSCHEQPLADTTPCTSDDLCLTGSQCAGGECIGGTPKDCFFEPVPNDCHEAVCNPSNGMCEPVPANEGEPCVDQMDLCTVDKTCSAGTCGGGTPKDCSQLTQGCDLGVCDSTTGQCTTMAVGNGQACDDLDACTMGEVCTSGTCGGGTTVTTCEQLGDGCCPGNCTAQNDIDCACSTNSLAAPYTGGNSQNGNMFDVVAKKNIEVQGFDVSIGSSNDIVEIYFRSGSFVGFETSSTGWTLAGSASVSGAGTNQPTPVPVNLSIQIPAGQTYGFYVTATSASLSYTNGTSVGNVLVENPDLQLLEGVGKSYPFGSTYSPRNFNGTVHYEQCGN